MIVLPISAGTACTLSLGNKILQKVFMNNYNKNRKPYEKDQHTIKSFDELCRKSSQDIVNHKNEYECLCIISTKIVIETKNESLL